MNRKQRRQADKLARKMFTEKDYREFKDGIIAETAAIEAKKQFKVFIDNFVIAMRKNHISEERIGKIIDDFQVIAKEKKGEEN